MAKKRSDAIETLHTMGSQGDATLALSNLEQMFEELEDNSSHSLLQENSEIPKNEVSSITKFFKPKVSVMSIISETNQFSFKYPLK